VTRFPGTLRAMRPILAVLLPLALAGCAAEVYSTAFTPYGVESPEFGVTGLGVAPTQANLAAFNNADPQVPDWKAGQICTLGYDTTQRETLPADPGAFDYRQIKCATYTLSFAGVPKFSW
jgi:hypothetical protein